MSMLLARHKGAPSHIRDGSGVNRCFLICKLEFVCRRIVIAVAAAMTRNAVSLACCGRSCTLMRASHCRRGGGRAAHAWFTRSAPPTRDEAWGVSMSVTCNRCSVLCASCIGLSDRDGAKVHVKASATCVVCTKACSTRTKRLVSRWHARDSVFGPAMLQQSSVAGSGWRCRAQRRASWTRPYRNTAAVKRIIVDSGLAGVSLDV